MQWFSNVRWQGRFLIPQLEGERRSPPHLGRPRICRIVQGSECSNPPGDADAVETSADIIQTNMAVEDRQQLLLLNCFLLQQATAPKS